ncbi:SMP-30/gluconolactonase/LRE family protein [Streptomyces sp. DH10]|uniref:SMP-30/gluconolactonase/LRE family protein n=1 Tax=Streptomyces sp. DH10 TaxID=3040121 RepID=UPI002442EB29|nr:superoxide dismutase [Streptomyces sp. DH10]MDG9711758.1 superoxide dismutase [Streptomyces sp. DH10]
MTRNHPQPSRRTVLGGAVAALAVAAGATGTAQAVPGTGRPTEFPLPDGWLPEGITIGGSPYAYMGSRADGAIYRTDLRTGKGRVLHEGTAGLASIGLKLDRDSLLYVAGGAGGTARIVDARTGELLTTYQLTRDTGPFINDVVLHEDRAWFTDSRAAVLHGVPRGRRGEVRALPLTGEWVQAPAGTNSANGLVATPDGRGLIVVNAGQLYRVDLETGHATEVTLRGAPDVAGGDGLVRLGRTLYVVQNRLNKITVWDLDRKAATATLTRTITDPRFDVPTTAARYGDRLYLVNARFTSPQTPETTFNAVAVSL